MRRAAALFLLICSCTCLLAAKKETSPPPPSDDLVNPGRVYMYPRPVETWLDVQIALARQAISCGPIDGVGGHQTALGLRAFQERAGIDTTGRLDNATRARLILTSHPFKQATLTAEDLARHIQRLSGGKAPRFVLLHEGADGAQPVKGLVEQRIDLNLPPATLRAAARASVRPLPRPPGVDVVANGSSGSPAVVGS